MRLRESRLNLSVKSGYLKKIDYSIQRVSAPLEIEMKIKFLFIPFGITNSLLEGEKNELKHFKNLGFIKKEKEFYLISTIGAILYIGTGILIGLLLKG